MLINTGSCFGRGRLGLGGRGRRLVDDLDVELGYDKPEPPTRSGPVSRD